MLFSFNVLLPDVHIIISVNLTSIIEDMNTDLKYLYSAMLLRSVSEEVEKKIIQNNSVLFCSSVSFSSFICFRMRMKA